MENSITTINDLTFLKKETNNERGYYVSEKNKEIRISNFLIHFDNAITAVRDGKPLAYLNGKLILENGEEIPFSHFPADYLADTKGLIKYFNNISPTKIFVAYREKWLLHGINIFNNNVPKLEEREFGYNKNLTEFVTPLFILYKGKKTLIKDIPIKYSESLRNIKLGFEMSSPDKMSEVRNEIVDKLLSWDKPEIILFGLAFTFMSLVHPYIKWQNPNKFYLMLKGPSGSGKTLLAILLQRFFGEFETLTPWSSTDTSMYIIGNAAKDCLIVIDDLKRQNFKSENAVNNAMAVLQTYSDGNSRQRATVDLNLKDDRSIRGHLLISAEDIVFSESSTLARGIIVNMESKGYCPEKTNELNILSKEFNLITPYIIDYIFRYSEKPEFKNLYDSNRKWLHQKITTDYEVSPDNLGRVLNNFAGLKTSFDIIKGFLFQNSEVRKKYEIIFNDKIINLLMENLDRIDNAKVERQFEEMLWNLVESDKLYFENIDEPNTSTKAVKIGYYKKINENEVKICLNVKIALKEISKYDSSVQTTEDNLITRLQRNGKISFCSSKKVSFGDNIHKRGGEWTGDFPHHIFGIREGSQKLEF